MRLRCSESLSQTKDTLIVFNHPCWDESGIGREQHLQLAAEFARNHAPFIHALELNGLRPWNENREVFRLAHALEKPVVSGGDRHALEPNAVLDLTNAASFAEFVEQVRAGRTDVLVTDQYREPFPLRILQSLEEVLQDYEGHGRGWRRWSDRVFYRCDDGIVRPLTTLFANGVPDQMVQDAVHKLERAGAKVTTISLPMHRDGIHVWNAIAVEGATMLMVRGNSMGTNWKGHYTTGLLDVYAKGWQSRANDLSETTKLVVMLGQYMQDNYHGRYYAKAQNIARNLRAAYDEALRQADLLVMPTLPMKATPIPAPTASREEYVARALEMLPNTCPFDVTGHPALTVPCGTSSGLRSG